MTYGLDLSCTADLHPTMNVVTGDDLMREVCFRRLYTPRGSLLSSPQEVTIDVREYLSAEADEDRAVDLLRGACIAALSSDPRILSVDVVVEIVDREATIAIAAIGSEGPFALTISASAATVAVLDS